MNNFAETGLRDELLRAIKDLGFEKPTPIQAQSIPQLLQNKGDLIALAQTGTGKTAAFGLPLIHQIDSEEKHTQALVLCPTRELCLQITKDLESFSTYLRSLNVQAVYGGAAIQNQIKGLAKGAQVVVGTPGRVLDLIKRKKLRLESVEMVVLDEADEMLSMGFKDDLDAILSATPDHRQTMLFSATMSKEVERLSKRYMNDASKIAVAAENAGAETVKHSYFLVRAKDRYQVLKRLADLHPKIYGIVFCRTRRETKEVAHKLMGDGYNADALHGDLSQAQRDEVMNRFRTRQLQMLVATDVAARGLDVNDLTHVINYNLPDDPESYTHRSGRTGRAGKTGESIAIIHSKETGKIRQIERISGVKFEQKQVPTGEEICREQLYSLIDKIEKTEVDEKQIGPFLPEIYKKLEWLSREDLIKHFVSAEFNRFLAYYKNAPDINLKGDQLKGDRRQDRPTVREKRQRVNFTRMCLNVGSRNKMSPNRLMGIVNEALDSGDVQIGKIDIMRSISFFEVDERFAKKLIQNAGNLEVSGIPLEVEVARGNAPSGGYPKNKKHKKKEKRSKSRDKGRRRR